MNLKLKRYYNCLSENFKGLNEKSICCICNKYFCSSCNFHLYSVYGFNENKYCYECYDYYYNI